LSVKFILAFAGVASARDISDFPLTKDQSKLLSCHKEGDSETFICKIVKSEKMSAIIPPGDGLLSSENPQQQNSDASNSLDSSFPWLAIACGRAIYCLHLLQK